MADGKFAVGVIIAILLLLGIAQCCSRRRHRRRSSGSVRRKSGSRSLGGEILSGIGAPSSSLGNIGDYYLDRSTNILYGPKTRAGWGIGFQLTGTPGSSGNTVLNGTIAPTSSIGNNGDFYINTVTNFIYGPKANGVWPPGVSLVGPPGTPGTTGASGTVLGLGEFVGFGAQAALSTTVATGAFRFDTTVANSAVGVASAPGNGGTVFTLQPGTYSFAYQSSLTNANGIVLYTGTVAGGAGAIAIDNNTQAYSSTATTWLSGKARLTVAVPTLVAVYPLANAGAIPAAPGSGLFVARMVITQYV